MKSIKAAVYHPPRVDLPFLAVVFGPDGEVLIARTVPSESQGDDLISQVFAKFERESGNKVNVSTAAE